MKMHMHACHRTCLPSGTWQIRVFCVFMRQLAIRNIGTTRFVRIYDANCHPEHGNCAFSRIYEATYHPEHSKYAFFHVFMRQHAIRNIAITRTLRNYDTKSHPEHGNHAFFAYLLRQHAIRNIEMFRLGIVDV